LSAGKAKGTAAETDVIGYLRDHGFPNAERRALNGNADRGDVAGVPGVVIEVKNAARVELAQWLDEALREGRNANAQVSAVWFKRRGKGSPGQWFVTMTGEQFTRLIGD
jgi:hypothetical protein